MNEKPSQTDLELYTRKVIEHLNLLNLLCFLERQTVAITDYSEELVRRLIEKVTVMPNKLEIIFKSGITTEVEL